MQNKKKVSKKQAKSRTKAPKQKCCTNLAKRQLSESCPFKWLCMMGLQISAESAQANKCIEENSSQY